MQASAQSWNGTAVQKRSAEAALVLLTVLSTYALAIKDYGSFAYIPFAFYFLVRYRLSLDPVYLRFNFQPAHKDWLRIYAIAAGVLLVTQVLTTALLPVLLEHSTAYKSYFDYYAKAFIGQNYWIMTAVMIFLAPWLEEVLFRGFLQRIFSKISPVVGIALPSIIFGFLHVNILSAMIFGIVFGIIAHKTKSLVIPMALHFANNFTCAFLQDSSRAATPLLQQVMGMKLEDYVSLFLALAAGFALVGFMLQHCLQRMFGLSSSQIESDSLPPTRVTEDETNESASNAGAFVGSPA